jgi:adenine-specific DNA-methyltransferase
LTSACEIIKKMTLAGSFTDFFFPHNEKLFEEANIDVLVFRYRKGIVSSKTFVNNKEMFCNVNDGIITFSESEMKGWPINEKFNAHVGIVSGRDEIYKTAFGNIDVLIDKDRVEKFIYIDTYPSGNKSIDEHLSAHKSELMDRKIKKFSEHNWFEWGAPRNISKMMDFRGRDCIYIRNMTRNKEVAFVGKVQYFGGALLCLIPKVEMSLTELHTVVEYINSEKFQKNYIYAGRFKIGHKQLCNALID